VRAKKQSNILYNVKKTTDIEEQYKEFYKKMFMVHVFCTLF